MSTGVNITNAANLLYQHYLYDIVETLNQNSELRQIVNSDYSWTGKEIEWVVHSGRNTGSVGFGTEGGAYPVPTNQKYQRAKAGRRFLRMKLQLTDGAIVTGASGKGVAADVVEQHLQRGMHDMLHFEDYFYGRDGSGSVGTLVDADLASSATDVECEPGFGGWVGQEVAILDSSNSYVELGRTTISSVEDAPNAAGNVLVNFSSTVSGAQAGDLVVPVIAGESMYNKAFTGFDKLIDNSGSSFQNVTLANAPQYVSHVLSSTTKRNLTPRLLRQAFAGLRQRAGSDAKTANLKGVMTNTMAIEFEEMFEGEIRIEPTTSSVGTVARKFVSSLGEIECMPVANAVPGSIFIVDASQIVRAVQKPFSWIPESGGIAGIFRADHSTAVYTAVASEMCNLFIKKRHTSAKITDLNEDLVTSVGW